MSDVWQRVRDRLREHSIEHAQAASPPVRRGTVIRADPLLVEAGELILEEGDDDVEVDEALKTTRPEVGDIVRVHTAEDGDYIISGRIVNG